MNFYCVDWFYGSHGNVIVYWESNLNISSWLGFMEIIRDDEGLTYVNYIKMLKLLIGWSKRVGRIANQSLN